MVSRRRAVIGYVVLCVAVAVAVWRVETLSNDKDQDIVQAQIDGCERQNQVRNSLRESYRDDIKRSKETNPDLFPDIPPEEFERLIRGSIDAVKKARYRVKPIDCETKFPEFD